MGIYDRDYYRDEPRGFFLMGPQTMVTNLIIVNIAIFVADAILLNGRISDTLALDADLLRKPWNAWQLVTHGFVHDTYSIWHAVGNMFFLWLFGREVEMLYGRREFLSVYLSLLVAAGLGWVLTENFVFHTTQSHAIGASGAVTGIMVLFVIHYPTRIFYFWGLVPVPVWVLAGLYILNDMVGFRHSVSDGSRVDNIAYAAHLTGAAYGLFYYKTRWSLGTLLPSRLSFKWPKRKPNLRLHEPPKPEEGVLDNRVDEILDKIHREGEASLTADERRVLEEASRRFQQRRR